MSTCATVIATIIVTKLACYYTVQLQSQALKSAGASTIFIPGIYDISLDEYLSERAHVSSSGLKRMLQSPLQLQRYLQRQHISTPQLDFGTAVHCALLEPERFQQEYVALPVKQVDLFHAEDMALIQQAGKARHFITEAQMAALQGICEQVDKQPDIVQLLKAGQAEQSLFWRDEASGIRCKIRPDMLVLPHWIVELKTTFDSSLAVFQRTCLMQRYHLSAAMYLQGLQQVTGQTPNYVYLVASRNPPYAVQTFVPTAEMLKEGERLFRHALTKLRADRDLSAPYISS